MDFQTMKTDSTYPAPSTPMPKWLLEAAKSDLIASLIWLMVALYLNLIGAGPGSQSLKSRIIFYLVCSYVVLFPVSCLIARKFYPEREGLVKIFIIGPLAISILTAVVLIAVGK